jgi:hypothetical protein
VVFSWLIQWSEVGGNLTDALGWAQSAERSARLKNRDGGLKKDG